MKTKKGLLLLLVLMSAVAFLVAPFMTVADAASDWPKDIGIGTKPIGSGIYAIGLSIAKVIPKHLKGLAAHAAPFGTESGFVRSMISGEIHMSITTSVFTYHAPRGLLVYAGAPTIPLRILAAGEVYYWPLMVRPGSGIETSSDMKGKKCMINYAGSLAGELAYKAKLKAYGLTEKDITLQTYGSVGEITAALKEGRTDCAMYPVSKGSPFVQELSISGKLKLVGDTDEALKKINELCPFYPTDVLPAKTYRGQDQPVRCASLVTHLGIDKRLPDDLVYAITAALYDHFDEWVSHYKPAGDYALPKAIDPATIIIPVHPGAIKYYKERGLWKEAHEKKNQELIAEEMKRGK
jgi:TRAP transporter TAXI family solute receptor